jgi:hypothetical protein
MTGNASAFDPGQRERRHKLAMVSAMVLLGAGLLIPLVESGHTAIFVASTGCLALCILLDLGISALAPHLLLPRLVAGGYALQCFWLVLVGALRLRAYAVDSSAPEITTAPLQAVLPNVLVPVSALLAVGFIRLLPVPLYDKENVWSQNQSAPGGISFYLALAAIVHPLYWPAVMGGLLDRLYFIRVLNGAFVFMPLLAGRYSRRLPMVRYLWLASMTLDLVIGAVAGSRFHSLLPPALFGVGYFLATPAQKKPRILLLLGAAALPAFVISGLIGIVRSEFGRGGIEVFNVDRIQAMLDSAATHLDGADERAQNDVGVQGIGRMVVWPNLNVAMMTPTPVPYRGLSSFPTELKATMYLGYIDGSTMQDTYDLGLGSTPARLYGYRVNTHTSVDFGILADGWSRGGIPIVLLFGFLLTTAFGLMECFICRMRYLPDCARLTIFMTLFYPALGASIGTLLNLFRSATLYLTFMTAFVWLAEKVRLRFETLPMGLRLRKADVRAPARLLCTGPETELNNHPQA